MEAALKALAAPRRRQILTLVRNDELSAGEIASHFDVTRPAVSQHLNVLKEAGLVNERRNGTRRLYRARPEGLAPVKEYLEEIWDQRIETIWSVLYCREPTAFERERVIAFLRDYSKLPAATEHKSTSPDDASAAERAAWTQLALTLLNTNEFLYVD